MTITAKIIADSIGPFGGPRMTTFEIEYPRFILAEVNTHRELSKNSASSRAIPIAAMHKQIRENMAMPVHWGKNQPGMQAKEELDSTSRKVVQRLWKLAIEGAIRYASWMERAGLHKQVANRITEPGMTMKTVISGTSWNNLWHLRDHPDAQPEFRELAGLMHQTYLASTPNILYEGEWHLPYVNSQRNLPDGKLLYLDENDNVIPLELARKVSASCCAQVSYRKNDPSAEKAEDIFNKLIYSTPVHASPVEHQATPIVSPADLGDVKSWPPGVTHVNRYGQMCSGNLKEWIQFRQLIPGESVPG